MIDGISLCMVYYGEIKQWGKLQSFSKNLRWNLSSGEKLCAWDIYATYCIPKCIELLQKALWLYMLQKCYIIKPNG